MMSNHELALQSLLTQSIESHVTHGIQLHIDSPPLGLDWNGSVGFTDRSHNITKETLTPLHPLRIASNTKTFVAAAILRLWEQQRLNLDISIGEYISESHSDLIQAKGYPLAAISPRHLLTHTSGLFDYADSKAFANAIASNLQHHWTRTEQIQLAMESGEPYGQPGEVCRYSDTGYILLGEIIEHINSQPLAPSLRQLLDYQRLGLHSTWLEGEEKAPENMLPLVHQYDKDLDSYRVDGSYDIYGGGGLISTVGDMARFMRALFTGAVYQSGNTLKMMLSSANASRSGPAAYDDFIQVPGEYRMGIDGGVQGIVFSHKGYLGTYAAYIPSLDMAIGLSVNQHGGAFRAQLIDAIFAIFNIQSALKPAITDPVGI